MKISACCLAVCFLLTLATPATGTQEKPGPGDIRLLPLPAAPTPTTTPKPAKSRPAKAAARRTDQQPAETRQPPKTAGRQPAAPVGALGPAIKLWYRPLAGTPRHIKGPNAILQKAARRGQPGRERDEITARQFLHANRALLRIKDPDRELQIYRHQVDGLGRRHLRLAQSFQNIPVWPADLLIHLDPQGNVDMLDGAYVPTPRRLTTRPVITAAEAIELARLEIAFPEAAILAGPQLIIHAPGDRPARLAWKMTLTSATFSNWLVAIDALTGQTRLLYDTTMPENVAGAGVDIFGETQALNVWKEGRPTAFYLVDTSKPMFDAQNSDPPSPQTTKGAIIVLDAANQPDTPAPQVLPSLQNISSTSATAGWLADGVSAAAALSATYDYYFDRHGRNSIDNQGGSIHAVVRLGNQYVNAFWSSELNLMAFGDGEPFAGALDIVAHELTHGVTASTAKLIYKDQPGALNEAFSDIFGEMVEARSTGASPDWLMGTKLTRPPFRNLADPSSLTIPGLGLPYPAKMSDYIQTTQDNGGVHLNSSIINHAYYLLAEGLAGAIGLTAAEGIFYRALNFHLMANSQFIDARLACIAAAEEIFGPTSIQAAKTAAAFDAVELFDDDATPLPPPLPPVNAADSAVFLYYSLTRQTHLLGVREEGDPVQGRQLAGTNVSLSRPSVAGDGSAAIFVDSSNDICFIDTDGRSAEECAGLDNVHSVAWTPDKKLYAYVPLDGGEPANRIVVVEKVSGTAKTYELKAPVIDDVTTNTILYADAMDFSADNRYLIYDAFNVMQLTDGSRLGAWSIYALDLRTEQTLALVPPVAGLDIGFPALSQTSDNYITFDALDSQTGRSTIYAGNLLTGELVAVAETDSGFGVPGYSGDDSAIVFSLADFTPTGFSLWQQALADDRLTPLATPALFLSDADFGVIFRRGTFVPPTAEIAISPAALNFGEIFVGKQANAALTVTNTGTADLQITALAVSGPDAAEFSLQGSCLGQVLTPSATCAVRMTFAPTAPTTKNASLAVQSDVPATPVVAVPLSGLGLAAGTRGDLNSDAGVDLTDAILALQVLAGLTPAQEISSAADLNFDEKIGLAEVIYILQKTGQQ